ncbi:MAG: hypothetical protein JSV86_13355 [Gemmatimonadota bacterium]|nr:MAG: hypothetical protein JSV86_13355 [Gemmatimonadota bacterium]
MYGTNLALGICLFALLTVTPGQQAGYENLLTVNDVEEVTGFEGIKLVPPDPTIGAGGDLNFALADGTLLLMASIREAAMYDQWRGEEGYFHAPVADLGDVAFEGPSFGAHRYALIFRKGDTAIALLSFFNMQAGGEPFLSQEKLREIAGIVIPRL